MSSYEIPLDQVLGRVFKSTVLRSRAEQMEIAKFMKEATLQCIQHDEFIVKAIAELREWNAAARAQDQRDIDADYRNYIVPV